MRGILLLFFNYLILFLIPIISNLSFTKIEKYLRKINGMAFLLKGNMVIVLN